MKNFYKEGSRNKEIVLCEKPGWFLQGFFPFFFFDCSFFFFSFKVYFLIEV